MFELSNTSNETTSKNERASEEADRGRQGVCQAPRGTVPRAS